MEPLYVVQISDSHLGATWVAADPIASLAATVAEVRRLPRPPDAVLVTGDIAENGTEAEYDIARELLAQLDAPIHVLPGNCDDRAALRTCFGLSGTAGSPVQYAVDVGPLRLVLIDTTRPGSAGGELDEERLSWLDAELAAATDRTTIVAMHHPPLLTGSHAWDEICLTPADRHGLAEVAGRHPHLRLIAAGHVHRTIVGSLSGCPVLTAPSTYAQAEPGLSADTLAFAPGPVGFVLHTAFDGELVSQARVFDRASVVPAPRG